MTMAQLMRFYHGGVTVDSYATLSARSKANLLEYRSIILRQERGDR